MPMLSEIIFLTVHANGLFSSSLILFLSNAIAYLSRRNLFAIIVFSVAAVAHIKFI